MGQGVGHKRERESPRLGSNIYREILPKLINWAISQSECDPFVSLAKVPSIAQAVCLIVQYFIQSDNNFFVSLSKRSDSTRSPDNGYVWHILISVMNK